MTFVYLSKNKIQGLLTSFLEHLNNISQSSPVNGSGSGIITWLLVYCKRPHGAIHCKSQVDSSEWVFPTSDLNASQCNLLRKMPAANLCLYGKFLNWKSIYWGPINRFMCLSANTVTKKIYFIKFSVILYPWSIHLEQAWAIMFDGRPCTRRDPTLQQLI